MKLGTLEAVKLNIDAPKCKVELNLRSLHDSSFINCKQFILTVNENF